MIKARPPCLQYSLLQPEPSHCISYSLQAAQLQKHIPSTFPFHFPFLYTTRCPTQNTCSLASGKKNTPKYCGMLGMHHWPAAAARGIILVIWGLTLSVTNHKPTPTKSCGSTTEYFLLHSLQFSVVKLLSVFKTTFFFFFLESTDEHSFLDVTLAPWKTMDF